MSTEPAAFFVFQKHSMFIPLRFVYPECNILIAPYEQLTPLHCLKQDHCPANKSCMDVLVKRVNYLFTQVQPEAEQILAYFKYRDRPDSIRAAVFTRDLASPTVMTLNRSAFKKFQREGLTFTWVPPMEYWLMSPDANLISVESLLKT